MEGLKSPSTTTMTKRHADGYFQSGDGILDTNMNAYCRNNPVNRFDPTGQDNNCPIHGNHFWQPNCIKCRPGYIDQLVKEANRGQPIWMPDGGPLGGGTINEVHGVEVKTNNITFIPPNKVKDLYMRKTDYRKIAANTCLSIISNTKVIKDLEFVNLAPAFDFILYMQIMNEIHSEDEYRRLCNGIEHAVESGTGLVIIEKPYTNDPRAQAGSSWSSSLYSDWSGSYGEYPYAFKPFN